jgi:hypothetical protein
MTWGDPGRLRAYTAATTARVGSSDGRLATYRQAIARLHAAPSDLPVAVPDRSPGIAQDLARLRAVDQQPARFATALLLADRVAFPGAPAAPSGPRERSWSRPATSGALAEVLATQLVARLQELLAADAELPAIYDELASVLSQLQDPALAAAVHGRWSADDLLALLQLAFDAQLVKHDPTAAGHAWFVDRDPMVDLLAPLGRSFEAAAARGAISEAFLERLFSASPPGELGWPGTTLLVSQLLVYGDPLGAGDAAVTAAFAAMVLSDHFPAATRTLHEVGSAYVDPAATRTLHGVGSADVDPAAPDLFAGLFHLEHLVGHAAASLAADPAAAARFLAEGANQTALLDRAAEGWWLGGRDGASAVLEAGLLVHPQAAGLLDRPLDPRRTDAHAYLSAVRHLVTEVAARGSVHASAARGLGIVLAPHHDSVRGQARDATHDDLLRVDADTHRDYLTNVAAHDAGLAALQETFAGWTAALYLEWAAPLSATSHLTEVPSGFLFDTKGLVDTYRLLEEALHVANVRHEERSALLLGAIDRAGGLARSHLVRRAGMPGGPVSFLAGEAVSFTTRHVTGWAEDRVLATGPMDLADFRTGLAHTLPQLTVAVLLDAVPDEDRAALVPVEPGPRPHTTERGASVWERLAFWSEPDLAVTEQVDLGRWPPEVLDGWLDDNVAASDPPPGATPRDWWLNVIVSDVRKGFEEPIR